MSINLNILDLSQNKAENKETIQLLIDFLSGQGINRNISIIVDDPIYKSLVMKYLETGTDSLLNCHEFLIDLNDYNNTFAIDTFFVIIGDTIPTGHNYWGEALTGFVAVIIKQNRVNIWHEIAHLFGAEDHYDQESKNAICLNKTCIMQYGKSEGEFCAQSIKEITDYIN